MNGKWLAGARGPAQIIEGCLRHGRSRDLELLECLVHGKAGRLQSLEMVRLVPRRNLCFDERAQHLFRIPALDFGGVQHLRRNALDLVELQAPKPGDGVRRQRGSCIDLMRSL